MQHAIYDIAIVNFQMLVIFLNLLSFILKHVNLLLTKLKMIIFLSCSVAFSFVMTECYIKL